MNLDLKQDKGNYLDTLTDMKKVKDYSNEIVMASYNKDEIEPSMTFTAPCKCIYCKTIFRGRFFESIHETVECPNCHRTLDFGDR